MLKLLYIFTYDNDNPWCLSIYLSCVYKLKYYKLKLALSIDNYLCLNPIPTY